MTYMYVLVCLHDVPPAIECLCECLTTILSHNYEHVVPELNTWTPKYSHIVTVVGYLGE